MLTMQHVSKVMIRHAMQTLNIEVNKYTNTNYPRGVKLL